MIFTLEQISQLAYENSLDVAKKVKLDENDPAQCMQAAMLQRLTEIAMAVTDMKATLDHMRDEP